MCCWSIRIVYMVFSKFKAMGNGKNARTMSLIDFYIIMKCWTFGGSPQLLMIFFQCAYVNKIDTLHVWFSKILTMVFNFINHIITIFQMLKCCIVKILELLKKCDLQWILNMINKYKSQFNEWLVIMHLNHVQIYKKY